MASSQLLRRIRDEAPESKISAQVSAQEMKPSPPLPTDSGWSDTAKHEVASLPGSKEATRPLFRGQALARLDTPQALDERLQVVSGAAWIAVAACLFITCAACVWSIFGVLRVSVVGTGVLIRENGMFVGINAPKAAWVVDLAGVGDTLARGDLIARLEAPEEKARVSDLQARISNIRLTRQALLARHEDQISAESRLADIRRKGFEETISLSTQRAVDLEKLLNNREQLLSAGNGTLDRVLDARERLFAVRDATARARSDMHSLDTALLALRASHAQELTALDRDMRDTIGQWEQARLSYQIGTEIHARDAGHIVMASVTRHALVGAGQRLVTLETGSDRLEALLYLPPDVGKKVSAGMEVRISPTNAKPEEYGSIIGTVRWIAPVPQGQAEIADRLGNPDLARVFAANGSPVAVAVSLAPEKNGVGYSWTSSRGHEVHLNSGTIVSGAVTVRKAPPIEFAIPAIRRWTGL